MKAYISKQSLIDNDAGEEKIMAERYPAGRYDLSSPDDCKFIKKTLEFLDALSDELPRERARYMADLVSVAEEMAKEAGCKVR